MAQQTINVGTAPNDGTGTPLRTAFQYTNSNFSELYTAVGPSGNNIVVPGNATITGDLTVRTNQLVVNSSGSFVGKSAGAVGTDGVQLLASGFSGFSASGTTALFVNRNTSDGTVLQLGRSGASAADFGAIAGGGFTVGLSGSEWMRINSTGLGVGASPTNKLTIGTGAYAAGTLSGTSSLYSTVAQGLVVLADGLFVGTRTGGDRFTLDTSGNVGIGVTPSAWGSGFKALEFPYASFFVNSLVTGNPNVAANFFYNASAQPIYKSNGFASAYSQYNGAHSWAIAPSGTAGNVITFNTAMTLDASGNLLVTKTSYGLTVGFAAASTGSIDSVMASAVGAQSTLNVYSTGAAAYRFYVGMNGTINATNTTISAISDARLKENVQDIDVGLGAILALKPRKFDWKAGKGKDIKGDRGFIAQEFEQVFPNLIDEWKDPAPEGEAPYKSVRQDLIPVLVKAIQELAAEVNALKNA